MRRIVTALGVALSAVLVFLAIGLVLLPAERVARLAADQMAAALGREVTIGGDVSMSIWPVLGATVGDVGIGNASWAAEPALLSVRSATVGVDARALLSGDIQITEIKLLSPAIALERSASGEVNWSLAAPDNGASSAPSEPQTTASEQQSISVRTVSIEDAQVTFVDAGARVLDLENVDLSVNWPEPGGPAQIQMSLAPAGAPVTVEARIAQVSALLAGERSELSARLAAAQSDVAFDGQAALSGDATGAVSLQTPDMKQLLSALGVADAALPEGSNAAVELTTDIALAANGDAQLQALDLRVDRNRIRGSVDLLQGTPLQINADLDAGILDLTQSGPAPTGGSSSGSQTSASSGWPTDPIDASLLSAFDGQVRLSAEAVRLPTLTLGPTRTVLRNDRARLVFSIEQAAAYGGNVTGQFVLNNRSGLSVGGTLAGQDISLEPFLTDTMDITRLSGLGRVNLEFLGVGQTVDAIMKSLRGSGEIAAGEGRIRGLDLDRLMRSGQGAGGTTVFDSLTARFEISNGVMRNDDLEMRLPNYEARGEGRVDLGEQRLDYTFTPRALRANDGRGIAIPVRVHGAWAAPRVEPDLEAIIDLNFSDEVDRLEEKAIEKIGESLGVTKKDGKDLEDKIEKEVGKALRNLFD